MADGLTVSEKSPIMYSTCSKGVITVSYFFQAGMVTNPTIWLVLSAVRIFLSLTTVTVTRSWVFFREFFSSLKAWKKINKSFIGLGSVRICLSPSLSRVLLLRLYNKLKSLFSPIWFSRLLLRTHSCKACTGHTCRVWIEKFPMILTSLWWASVQYITERELTPRVDPNKYTISF